MIFTASEPPQHIVVPPAGGKWGIWFVYHNKFKTIKITGQTAYLKKKRASVICYENQHINWR